MSVIIATTSADQLGGAFARAYRAAGGPRPSAIITVPDRTDLSHPAWATPWVSWRLFGVRGSARLAATRILRTPLSGKDASIGLVDRWPACLVDDLSIIQQWPSLSTPEDAERLRALAPDVLVSIGLPRIVPQRVLECARIGSINIHNGRLPRYRGHFATFWEVLSGEAVGGVTIHEMTPAVDAGRVLMQELLPVKEQGSFLDLLLAKKRAGGRMLAHLLNETKRLGRFPEDMAVNSMQPAYFGWPTLHDIGRFQFRVSAS